MAGRTDSGGFFGWLALGTRAGLGDGNRVLLHAARAALRRPGNWVLPGLLGVLLAAANMVMTLSFYQTPGIGLTLARIVLMDYLVFFFGWIAGWVAASRWRRNLGFVEELVMTPLRPAVVGNLLFSGNLAVWAVVLLGLAAVDAAMVFAIPERHYGATSFTAEAVASMIFSLPFYLVLAWFHLETLRIAYWMFASAALPRFKLLNKAIINAILIPIYVGALTALGSGLAFVTAIPFSIITDLALTSDINSDPWSSHLGWTLGSVPALLLVGLLKRGVSKVYERGFWRAYLLFTWYGAGELEHPRFYPSTLQQATGPWMVFLAREERKKGPGSGTRDPGPEGGAVM